MYSTRRVFSFVAHFKPTILSSSNSKSLPLISQLRFAGHSKWANIKHTKAAKDAERSRIFDKLSRQMRAVIKEQGSADPKNNLRLAQLIVQAKGENMPGEKIQTVVKGALTSNEDLKPATFEARGPGGCYFVIEALTNNLNRTRANVLHILRKHNSDWSDGASKHHFMYKGQVTVDSTLAGKLVDQDTALEHAIAIGAEDVEAVVGEEEVPQRYQFICDMKVLKEVRTGLTDLGFTLKSYGLEYRPVQRVELSEDQINTAQKIFRKLDEDQDIVNVYDNIV